MMKRLVMICCISLVYVGAHAGSLYKWKDADGNVHFTQKRPPAEAVSSDEMETKTNRNSVKSNWSNGMQRNAREFMNKAGVRRVWVDRSGKEVEGHSRY